MTTRFESITTKDTTHNPVNMLAELMLLNKDLTVGSAPWRGAHKVWWGKTVAALNKLMKVHKITHDQLAFYVYRCEPTGINGPEFGKMAVVAKKLLRRYDLEELVRVYRDRYENANATVLTAGTLTPRPTKKPSLAELLKELEAASG